MAGVFALLYGLFSFVDSSISSAKEYDFVQESKKIALEKGNLTYMDYRGREHFIETNELCETTFDNRNGHRVIKSINTKGLPTGRILFDYTENQLKQKELYLKEIIEKAKKDGIEYIKINCQSDISLDIGIEVNTGKKYAFRESAAGTIKKVKAEAAGKASIDYSKTTTKSVKEKRTMKLTVEANSRLIVYLTGEVTVTNGVCSVYYMFHKAYTGAFEFVTLKSQFSKLEKRSI